MRAARDADEDMVECVAEIQEDSKEPSEGDEEAASEGEASNNEGDSNYESLPEEEEELADWAAPVRMIQDDEYQSSDSEYDLGYSASA